MLPGLMPIIPRRIPKVTFIGSYTENTGKTGPSDPYSFTVDVGTITAPTILVMGIMAVDGGWPRTIVSATIGGSSATMTVTGTANQTCTAIAHREVTSGGSTVFTFAASLDTDRAGLGLWKIEHYMSATASDTDTQSTSGASSLTSTLTVPFGGCIVAVSAIAGTGTVTWSGATEAYDDAVESTDRQSGASNQLFAGTTNQNVTVNFGSSRRGQLCCAAWV